MARTARKKAEDQPKAPGPTNPWDALDGDWYYLGVEAEGALAIAMLNREGGAGAPLFSSREVANGFLGAVPPGAGIHELAAHDMRAKEEWLRAAIQQGAVTLDVEPLPDELEPRFQLGLAKALAYILSHRRYSACI